MVSKIRLTKKWNGNEAGAVIEVGTGMADRLIADGYAEPAGARATKKKIASPATRKTSGAREG